MNIKQLFDDFNFSKKTLTWIIIMLIALLPSIWLVSSKLTSKDINTNERLNNVEKSIRELTIRFDSSEEIFNEKYIEGIDKVIKIIEESEGHQIDQLSFIIENWSEENKQLIKSALELRQSQHDEVLQKITDDAYNVVDKNYIQKDNKIYTLENADLYELDSISKNYMIIFIELNKDQSYLIKYKEFQK